MTAKQMMPGLLLLAGCSVACFGSMRSRVELTQQELTKRINETLPVEKHAGVFSLTLDNAVVVLSEGSDEIGVELDATVRLGPIKIPSGRVGVVGKLSYDAQRGYILLYEPRIRTLELPGVHHDHRENAQRIVNDFVNNLLPVVPLHKLDGGAKWALKSMSVEHGSVWVEVGL